MKLKNAPAPWFKMRKVVSKEDEEMMTKGWWWDAVSEEGWTQDMTKGWWWEDDSPVPTAHGGDEGGRSQDFVGLADDIWETTDGDRASGSVGADGGSRELCRTPRQCRSHEHRRLSQSTRGLGRWRRERGQRRCWWEGGTCCSRRVGGRGVTTDQGGAGGTREPGGATRLRAEGGSTQYGADTSTGWLKTDARRWRRQVGISGESNRLIVCQQWLGTTKLDNWSVDSDCL